MLDTHQIAGRASVVGSGRGIYVLSLFLLAIGLARSMGADAFGEFQQVFMFNAFFIILTLGIPETMYYFLPRLKDDERPGYFGQTLIMLFTAGLLVAVMFIVAAPFLARIQDNPGIVGNLRVFGVYGAFMVFSAFADPIFITYHRLGYLFILSALHGLFFIALTAWRFFVPVSMSTLFWAMMFFGAVKLAVALVMLMRLRPETGPIWFFRGRRMILLQLTFALPVAMSKAIEIISVWLDKFVVSAWLGKEALGVFFVGAIEIPFIAVLLSSIYSVITPVLNKLNHENDNSKFAFYVNKSLSLTAKIIWPLFAWLITFADHLIPLVFGEGYEASVPIFRIYLFMMPLRIALFGVIVIALGKSRAVFWTSFGALAVNAVLNVALVELMGMPGPAIATVISTWLHVAILLVIIVKNLELSWLTLIPCRTLTDTAVACLGSSMAAYWLTFKLDSDIWVIALTLTIFMVGYLVAGSRAGLVKLPRLNDLTKGPDSGNGTDHTDG